MPSLGLSALSAVLMGLGATLTFDLWGLFLRRVLKIPASNLCLVGRWLSYMPEGQFWHTHIAASPPRRAECAAGWIAHYLIGISFAGVFVALFGSGWLQHPAPLPALVFGVVTVCAPFFIMHPAMGFGWASSGLASPAPARLRSITSHAAFGAGLYLFGLLSNTLL